MLNLILAAMVSGTAVPGDRANFEWSSDLRGKTVLVAGAHPDDEWGVSPLLADACLDRGAKCHFVVASEAQSFGCILSMGLKDAEEYSRLRRLEMKRSAAIFGGSVEFFGWEDLFYGFNQKGTDKTLTNWAAAAGGHEALVSRWLKVLREQRPAIVFTLDPRHGSTCHPGHRANVRILIEALHRMPVNERPELWFEQTDNIEDRSDAVAAANKQVGYVAWPELANETQWFDANRKLRSGRRAYDYALLVRRTHATQYPEEASGKSKPYASRSLRQVPLAKYVGQTLTDYCTPLAIDLPTLDIPGNKEKFGLK